MSKYRVDVVSQGNILSKEVTHTLLGDAWDTWDEGDEDFWTVVVVGSPSVTPGDTGPDEVDDRTVDVETGRVMVPRSAVKRIHAGLAVQENKSAEATG